MKVLVYRIEGKDMIQSPIQEGERPEQVLLQIGGIVYEIEEGGGNCLNIRTLEGRLMIEPVCANVIRVHGKGR